MDQKEMYNVLGLQTNLGPRTAKLETVTSHTRIVSKTARKRALANWT